MVTIFLCQDIEQAMDRRWVEDVDNAVTCSC